jgi:hypothetical protein
MPTPTPSRALTPVEARQFARLLRQVTDQLEEIHSRLSDELADVTQPQPKRTDGDARQARSSDDTRRLLQRFALAVDVLRAQLDQLEERELAD